MFDNVRLRGSRGAIVWGYLDAAVVRHWSIVRHAPNSQHDGRWRLAATFDRVDKSLIVKRPLLFTAPLEPPLKGFWCWSLQSDTLQIGAQQLVATLGPMER
jgi:hypothetical protein